MPVDKCKLPAYVPHDPLTLFRAVEACFYIHSIRRNADRAALVVAALPAKQLQQVSMLLSSPSSDIPTRVWSSLPFLLTLSPSPCLRKGDRPLQCSLWLWILLPVQLLSWGSCLPPPLLCWLSILLGDKTGLVSLLQHVVRPLPPYAGTTWTLATRPVPASLAVLGLGKLQHVDSEARGCAWDSHSGAAGLVSAATSLPGSSEAGQGGVHLDGGDGAHPVQKLSVGLPIAHCWEAQRQRSCLCDPQKCWRSASEKVDCRQSCCTWSPWGPLWWSLPPACCKEEC